MKLKRRDKVDKWERAEELKTSNSKSRFVNLQKMLLKLATSNVVSLLLAINQKLVYEFLTSYLLLQGIYL